MVAVSTPGARRPPPVVALHRYFLQANIMRERYDEQLVRNGAAAVDGDQFYEQWRDLCLWYGCLYVVVEGWQQLGLHADYVDPLLMDDESRRNLALLKQFRHGVFHFQPDYWDARFIDFIAEGAASAAWARALNRAFGRYFLEWFETQRRKPQAMSGA